MGTRRSSSLVARPSLRQANTLPNFIEDWAVLGDGGTANRSTGALQYGGTAIRGHRNAGIRERRNRWGALSGAKGSQGREEAQHGAPEYCRLRLLCSSLSIDVAENSTVHVCQAFCLGTMYNTRIDVSGVFPNNTNWRRAFRHAVWFCV